MNKADRHRLLFGPYGTPRVRAGRGLECEFRGSVVVTGLSNAPIPWPVGKRPGKSSRARTLVIFGRLAEAVRRESNQAVAHWWGVTAQTVTAWRKALGVEPTTEGTHRLRSAYAHEPVAVRARAKAHAKANDPARCEKIAAARRGKPRPPHVIEAVRRAHLGTKHSEETRRKISEAHKRRGTRPPGQRG